MQNVIIPLDTKIDTDTVSVTHIPDDIRFEKKNTIEYNGLLSNLTYTNGTGVPSTTGKELKLENGQLLGTAISSTTKAVKSVDKFNYSVKGKIVDTRIATDGVYTIIKDSINDYHLFIDEDYCGKVVKQTRSYQTNFIIEEQTAFIERSGTTCYFVKSWVERRSDNSTRVAIIKRLSVNRTTHTNNSTSYDTIITKTFNFTIGFSGSDALGTYYKHYYMIGPVNNAANNVYGANYEDMRKCWFNDADNSVTKEFIGCVSDTGNVSGQPYFNCLSLGQIYEKDNGVLVFYPTTTTPATLITANKANVESMKATPTSTTDTPNQVGQIDTGSMYGAQAYNFYRKSTQAMSGPSWNWPATLAGSSKYWVELNPTKSTGVAGPNAKVAHDCFPYIGQECNKLFNRGTLWDYGEGWATSVFQIRSVQQVESGGTYYDPTLVVSFIALNKNFETRNGNTTESSTITSSYRIDVGGIESYNDSTVTTGLRPYRVNTEDETLANATVFTDKGRFITLNSTNINSGTQPTITYSIGGDLDGFVSLIPEQRALWSDSNYNIYGLYYNGLLTGVSVNSTLLDTPSNGIEHIDIKMIDTDLVILLDNKKFTINELGSDNVQISKVADFLYKTNLLCPTNFIYEDSKTISLIRGAIPFIGYTWNTSLINSLSILMPDVGNSANDIFEIASGMNTTLDSDIPVASYLLPAVQIPTYVASSDLDNVNKVLILERKMLVKPDLSVCYETDLIDVYFTHTLYSTDITYKTSFNGDGVETYNDKLKDTSWWITSDIVIFPIGIATEMLGVNYYAPTVELGSNYTAQLYTHENTTFAIFNSAQQIYEGNQIFTIYTNNYYYDGQAVYYVGGSNENISNEFVCYVLGMKFLCNSGTEAYFWSDWEKRLYVFTGSNTMQAADRFSIFGELKDSLYSSHEQALYLLFKNDDTYTLICRTQKDNYKIEFTSTNDCYLLTSTKGAYIVLDDGSTSPSVSYTLYRPVDEANTLPLEIETEFIGDEGSLTKYGYADIQVYNYKKTVTLNIKMTIRNGIEETVETKTVKITPNMFKGTTYRCRVTPKNNIGTAFKLDVSSDDVSITYMAIGMEQTPGLPGAPVLGRT